MSVIEDALSEIRSTTNLKYAKVKEATIYRSRRELNIVVITNDTYSPFDVECANKIFTKYMPTIFNINVTIVKVKPNEEMIRGDILNFIQTKIPIVASLIVKDDIDITQKDNAFDYVIPKLDYMTDKHFSDLNKYLNSNYCETFNYSTKSKTIIFDPIKQDRAVYDDDDNYTPPIRQFDIEGYDAIDSKGKTPPKSAVYMCDFDYESQGTIICGKIIQITERSFKNKKTGEDTIYYRFTIDDTTACKEVTYFVKKKSERYIKALQEGDSIVCEVKNEMYRGKLECKAMNIDRGRVPSGFVPKKNTGRAIPKEYKCVFPVQYNDYSQNDMFHNQDLPSVLLDNVFVVVDFETTGLNSEGEKIDSIIECSAYKVIKGEIKEKFTTFVAPDKKPDEDGNPYQLPREVVELTHITDDMLKGAPTYDKVMPDLVKFCSNAILVGHNIKKFDIKFLKHYAGKLGFEVENEVADTLYMVDSAFKIMKRTLANNKLSTIAEAFGIEFDAHRSENDALVTAKVFIELVKVKKCL